MFLRLKCLHNAGCDHKPVDSHHSVTFAASLHKIIDLLLSLPVRYYFTVFIFFVWKFVVGAL